MPRCAEDPIRMYCDFSHTLSGMIYYGRTADDTPEYVPHLKNINGVRFTCSTLGL